MSPKHDIATLEPPSSTVLSSQVEHPQQTAPLPCMQSHPSQTKTPHHLQQLGAHLQNQISHRPTGHPQQQASVLQLQTTLPSQTDSALMALPLEIKQDIFSYLEGPEPTLIILRRTHPHFRYIIPKRNHRKVLDYAEERDHLMAADQLAADDKQPNLFLPNHLACFTCLNVMTSDRFSDRNTYKARRVGGKDAHKRFCLDCGLKDGKYEEGQTIYIGRAPYVLMHSRFLTRSTWEKFKFNPVEVTDGTGRALGLGSRYAPRVFGYFERVGEPFNRSELVGLMSSLRDRSSSLIGPTRSSE